MSEIIFFLKKILGFFKIAIIRTETLKEYRNYKRSYLALKYLKYLNQVSLNDFFERFELSKSQALQDLVVLSILDFKKGGYFVEFGAADGIFLSNTFLLEKHENWKGILSEPSKKQNQFLKANRNCHLDYRCVWSESGKTIEFVEAKISHLSTIKRYKKLDAHKNLRKEINNYFVDTITLEEMLTNFDAPSHIDFISIDTEGSEYEILKNFDFSKYSFSVLLIEHNFTTLRDQIYDLLTKNGYHRVMQDISYVDDWYISSTIMKNKF